MNIINLTYFKIQIFHTFTSPQSNIKVVIIYWVTYVYLLTSDCGPTRWAWSRPWGWPRWSRWPAWCWWSSCRSGSSPATQPPKIWKYVQAVSMRSDFHFLHKQQGMLRVYLKYIAYFHFLLLVVKLHIAYHSSSSTFMNNELLYINIPTL